MSETIERPSQESPEPKAGFTPLLKSGCARAGEGLGARSAPAYWDALAARPPGCVDVESTSSSQPASASGVVSLEWRVSRSRDPSSAGLIQEECGNHGIAIEAP